MVFDRRATKHPVKIRTALRVGAAPAPRRVAGSLNRTSAIRLASALRVIRRRSQRCYTSHGLGALGDRLRALPLVAMGFVTASLLGVLCSTNVWLSIACLVTVAAAAGTSSDVFAIPALVTAGAFGAYLIVVVLLALPLMRKAEGEGDRLRASFLPIWRDTEKATIATRVVVVVATASLLSFPLGVHHTYWTVMVPGAVLQPRFTARRHPGQPSLCNLVLLVLPIEKSGKSSRLKTIMVIAPVDGDPSGQQKIDFRAVSNFTHMVCNTNALKGASIWPAPEM